MNKILFFLLIIITISCKSKREREIIKYLTNNDYKFWYFYEYATDLENPIRHEVCYFNNGKKIKVRLDTVQMKRYLYDPNNMLAPDIEIKYVDEWELINDSTLLFARNYKINLILLNDIIFSFYSRVGTKNDTTIWHKSPHQEIKIEDFR